METLIYEGTMTALSSITHNGGQSFGIESKLRREKFVQPNGTVEEIPLLSGNGIRGKLRDLGMWQMCRALGFGVNEETGAVSGLTLSAFYFLFSGGSLGEGKSGIDIDYARKLRETIPLASVFGGAVGNQIMPGKLKVGKAIPICAETAHLLPTRFAETAGTSIWDYLQTEMYTRKDDDKNEKLRGMVAENAMKQLQAKGLVETLPEAALQVKQARNEAPQQMMYHTESFAAGTRFYWKLTLEDLTNLEYDAFMTTLAEFSKMPYVGGKSAVGLGEVAVNFDSWFSIDSRLDTHKTEAVAKPVGTAYAEHLRNNGVKIKEILETI